MLKAFVTGGTGFIGANVVRSLLEYGYKVKALVRSQSNLNNLKNLDIEIVTSDLNNPNLANLMADCQVLFHVAAHYSLWQKDKDLLYQYNVLGTKNVLEAARKANIERTIYTSSVAAIGVGKNGQIVNETYQSPVENLIGHYKKSKFWAEQEAKKAISLGQDIVIVNPSTPIGAFDLKPTPTGEIIVRFLDRKMPVYVDTGLNFISVKDVALGHILALEKGKTGDRYILGHQNLTLKQLLDQLAEITDIPAPNLTVPTWLPLAVAWMDEIVLSKFGKQPSVALDGVKMSQQKMYYNPSKAVTELGLPQSPLKQALTEAVKWFQEK
jgi:dihydroflavonol-4-reductase